MVRVTSTAGQNLTVYRAALKAAGCTILGEAKASGTGRKGRAELSALLEIVRPGYPLVVTRIDRLARSMRDLQNFVYFLKGRNVGLRATVQPIDTGSAVSKAFLDQLGAFSI